MSWTEPKTWSYKEAPGSDSLNEQIRDNLGYLKLSLPAGVMLGYGGGSAPEQWLLCDGTAVSRSTYADLFSAIGTSYGVGNGSTTFNLPNYRGRVMVGYKSTDSDFDSVGEIGGAKTVSIAHVHSGPSHTHTGPSHTHTGPSHQHKAYGDGGDLRAAIGRNNSANDDIAFAHVSAANPVGGGASPLGASTAIDGSAFTPGSITNFVPVYGYVSSDGTGNTGASGTANTGASGTANTGAMSANATPSIVQPYQVANFIIKY